MQQATVHLSHGNNEACVIRTSRALYATATYFATQLTYDYVEISGTQYSGTSGPTNVLMHAGDTLGWHANGAIAYGGWTICGSVSPMAVIGRLKLAGIRCPASF